MSKPVLFDASNNSVPWRQCHMATGSDGVALWHEQQPHDNMENQSPMSNRFARSNQVDAPLQAGLPVSRKRTIGYELILLANKASFSKMAWKQRNAPWLDSAPLRMPYPTSVKVALHSVRYAA